MKTAGKLLSFLVALLLVLVPMSTVLADWGDFFNPDGTIKEGVVDLGEQSVDVDWMPDLPQWVQDLTGIGSEATYHVYALADGETVLAPTSSTLFFMAMNPTESGLIDSNGQIGNGLGMALEAAGIITGGQVTPSEAISGILSMFGMTQTDQLVQDILDGKSDIWSTILTDGSALQILKDLANISLSDQNIYTLFLLYNSCSKAPTGCPAELLKLMTAVPTLIKTPVRTATPVTKQCKAPEVIPGKITATSKLIDPAYPVVVGQDPKKRGVDLRFSLTISPTIYRYQQLEVVDQNVTCVPGTGGNQGSCPAGQVEQTEDVWDCVTHEKQYCEPAAYVDTRMSLFSSSRSWILGELAQKFPGASLKHPDWRWTGGKGGCGGGTYSWSLQQLKAQVADPGFYGVRLSGRTNGTPVSPPRSFDLDAGSFGVYLMESTIIH